MSDPSAASRTTRAWRWTAYALPAFGLSVVGIPVYVYLPKFYTDVVGVGAGTLGLLILGVRLFDAISDSAIGALSDHTRSRFGRRRPWIALAVWPLAASIVWLFAPPTLAPGAAAIWFGVGLFALFLFWTAVTVPYESLGPEISYDYDERTTLLGLRDGLLLVGTLVAAASPALVSAVLGLGDGAAAERARFRGIAVIYAPLVIGLCTICVVAIHERPSNRQPSPRGEARLDLAARLRAMLRVVRSTLPNRPFVILLVSYGVAALGSNLPATLILYYVEYVLQDTRADLFLLLYFVTGILLLPAWIAIAHRVGKKPAWLAAMAINTLAFLCVFFLGPGQGDLYAVLVVVSGLGFGGTIAIPSAMQADVIDYDELLTGERREGLYVGIWNFVKKFTAALSVGAALVLLGRSGYEANVEQSESVRTTLRWLYAGVPSLLNLAAIGLAWGYPIDRARHREIREAAAHRRTGGEARDPLRDDRHVEPRP